ncbi:hypothetical protein L6452_13186 [Arctium lappa]|uniref:Uncharacterized protein n=1 Tax=Arctium lappa TaxID=4217 RepID=A0ACB9CHH7_ARCLA|nr:hypothetical protein L6452_13186 [Arctium lappa]
MNATRENDTIEAFKYRCWKVYLPSLPQVVANMKKLRWFSCVEYPATSFSREFQPTMLCCLTLKSSMQQQLWEGYKHLPNLKVLDLNNSSDLVES